MGRPPEGGECHRYTAASIRVPCGSSPRSAVRRNHVAAPASAHYSRPEEAMPEKRTMQITKRLAAAALAICACAAHAQNAEPPAVTAVKLSPGEVIRMDGSL